jgi:hypothetical protein
MCDQQHEAVALNATRALVHDPDLPGSRDLVAHDVPHPLAFAYQAVGSSISGADPIQVRWWPGRELTIRYRVEAHGGRLAGQTQAVATVGDVPVGALAVASDEAQVGVWVLPHDPLLPGLASALDLTTATGLLRRLGSRDEATAARLRSYRPGRRAVVELRAGRSSLYLKVVRPSRALLLHRLHRHLAEQIPVPDSLGLSADLGIVVMKSLDGLDLRSVLRRGGAVPTPEAIASMIGTLPTPVSSRATRSPLLALPNVIGLLSRLAPNERTRLAQLAGKIGSETEDATTPSHGDFHEAQILTRAGRPVALLDIDTYGWGRPGDDPATMLGHVDLLASGCNRPAEVVRFAHCLNRRWDDVLDPVDLRRRTAAVVLGLATGPFRVQRPDWPREVRARIDTAERWVENADRVDERSLTATSDVSHGRARR